MPRFTQSGRPLSLATPLPADTLLLASLAGTEAVSRPYRIELTLLAEAPVPFDALLGQAATVTLAAPGSPPRMIRGVLDEIDQDDRVGGPAGQDTFLRYRAVLVPRLDLLRHLVRSRVFQAVSVVDILTQTIKAEWGLDLRVETASTPVVRDYVVQYQESDLAFVSRLMEDEGLRYYFDHTTDRETLVVADGASAPPALHKVKTLAYLPASGGVREAGRVQALRRSQRITSTGASVRDYSFQKAASTLDADAAVQSSAAAGRITHALDHGFSADGRQMLRTLEFPAGHGRRFDGISPGGSAQPDEIAKLFTENARLAELIAMRAAASAVSFTGSTDLGHLVPGYAVTVANHFDADGDYLVTAVTHAGDVSAAYLRGADDFAYAATFALLPASIPFVPQKVTPRPRISGVQTAKVVGPKGQDIFVDPFGRVKVKFPWDRSAGFGPENSCWLRVSQIWAGRRWGAFFWPRVGHEVVVAFEEGDPDRPIVTGSVYNGLNLPPFELPANRVKAGIKSFSASGDIEALCDQMKNFNGIVFHDEKGNEHTEIHSERNHYHNAESNSFHNVNGTHRVNVSKAHSHHVGNIPSGSGSGGGDSDGPSFLFTTTTDMDKWFGINFTSVAGINHTNTLGLLSSFTVGEYAQIVVNPIGMAADGVGGLLPDKLSALAVAAAAPVGGIVGVTMGTNTQLSYGTPISIVRSGRAAVSSSMTMKDSMDKVDAAFMAAAGGLAVATAAAGTAGMFVATYDNYESDAPLWEVLLAATGVIGAVWTEVEVIRALYQQVVTAKRTAAANETLAAQLADLSDMQVAAQGYATIADNLVSMFTADQVNLNELKYTGGTVGDYCKARIIGAENLLELFAGKGTLGGTQSIVAMDPENIKLIVGTPLLEPSVLLSAEEITLTVGPSSGILIAAEGIELRFTDLIRITITEMGIDFVAGPTRMSLSPEAGFSVSVAGVSEMRLTAEDLNVRSVSGMLDFAAAYELVALSLKETMAATSERAAAVLRDV